MSKACLEKNTPEWFYKGNIYQINPRTFSKEGTIAAVTKELPFIAELGFKILYFCPIFKEDDSTDVAFWSPRQIASNTGNPKNPYRMNDYFEIDPEYGSMDDLRLFVAEAHRLGMKVMLDLVYWHIGPNADILKIHPDFAIHDDDGNIMMTPYHFPMLNFGNAGLREYLWCNMTYYVGVIEVDGYRCDVGDQVPIDFWVEGRRRIKAIKPDAVMLNEGFNWSYLEEGFDASYCPDMHVAIYDVLKSGEGAEKIKNLHCKVYNDAPNGAIMMRDIENHDIVTDVGVSNRLEVIAGHEGMELVEVFDYIIDGIPLVYCGNELGDTADLSMFANRFHMGQFSVTDRSIKNEDYSIRRQNVIKALNALKSQNDILKSGDTKWLGNSREDKIVSFARCYNGEKIVFIGNFSSAECVVNIDLLDMKNREILFNSEATPRIMENGEVALPAYGYLVVKQ